MCAENIKSTEKRLGPSHPKDRNDDKNIHVTSTNDVRNTFGRSNDFTSKAENIGCIKALLMDRRVLPVRAHVATRRCPVAGPPPADWIHRMGVGAGLVISIGQ
jgi:hypothetical protein